MKLKSISSLVAALALLAGSITTFAGTHTWSGAADGNWSNPANWSGGGVPAIFETPPLILEFPSGAANYSTTNDIGGFGFYLAPDAVILTGNNYVIAGNTNSALVMTGNPGYNNFYCAGTSNVFDSSLQIYLSATNAVYVGPGDSLFLNSIISGPGGLTFDGSGSAYLQGITTNTFTGTVNVQSGNVYLDNYLDELYLLDPPAMGGSLLIVGVTNTSVLANVYIQRNTQFTSNCDIVINPSGRITVDREFGDSWARWYFGTDDDELQCVSHSLTLNGGALDIGQFVYYTEDDMQNVILVTNYASLTVASNLVSYASPNPATISQIFGPGQLILSGSNGDVASGELFMATSSEGFTKTGPGYLEVQGGNHYLFTAAQGLTQVLADGVEVLGTLTISNAAQLDINASCALSGDVHLCGFGLSGHGAALNVQSSGVYCEVSQALYVDGDTAINVSNPTDELTVKAFNFGSYVSGTNNLYKLGAGTLQFLDFAPNTTNSNPFFTNTYVDITNLFSGTLYVQGGTVEFNSDAMPDNDAADGGIALNGPIVIGTNDSTVSCTVLLDADGQLNPNANITINDGCHLSMTSSSTQAIGGLTLNGGVIAGLGEFILNGDVTANFATYQPIIDSDLTLGSNRTFTVGSHTTLALNGSITDNSNGYGITKIGPGELDLAAANSYAGGTTINAGRLGLFNTATLGSNYFVFVNPGGELDLEGGVNLSQYGLFLFGNGADGTGALKATGTNTWAGLVGSTSGITINVATNSLLLVSGQLSSTANGLIKAGPGILELAGTQTNSYPGATIVQQGALWLNNPANIAAVPGPLIVGTGVGAANSVLADLMQAGQLSSRSTVSVNSDGNLFVGTGIGAVNSAASLSGSGSLGLGFATFNVGSDNTSEVFSGPISGLGSAQLVKTGTGTWTLSGTGNFFGQTLVGAGTLLVNGALPNSSVVVSNSATLGGNGMVGPVTSSAGYLSPGCLAPGILSASGNVSLGSGDSFVTLLDGTNPGTGYNQLSASGAINLGGATLKTTLGYSGAVSNKFIIIANKGASPVTGTFNGLPEGAKFSSGSAQFLITYKGGAGNDVVLTQLTLATPPDIGNIQNLGNGQMKLTGTGSAGAFYDVLATTNLISTNWITIGTIQADGSGNVSFTDSNAVNFSMRFYRFKAD